MAAASSSSSTKVVKMCIYNHYDANLATCALFANLLKGLGLDKVLEKSEGKISKGEPVDQYIFSSGDDSVTVDVGLYHHDSWKRRHGDTANPWVSNSDVIVALDYLDFKLDQRLQLDRGLYKAPTVLNYHHISDAFNEKSRELVSKDAFLTEVLKQVAQHKKQMNLASELAQYIAKFPKDIRLPRLTKEHSMLRAVSRLEKVHRFDRQVFSNRNVISAALGKEPQINLLQEEFCQVMGISSEPTSAASPAEAVLKKDSSVSAAGLEAASSGSISPSDAVVEAVCPRKELSISGAGEPSAVLPLNALALAGLLSSPSPSAETLAARELGSIQTPA